MQRLLTIASAVLMCGVVPAVTQAHNTRWSWTESYAETRVVKGVRYKDPYGGLTEAEAWLRQAQQRHDIVKAQSDACSCGYSELSSAIITLAVAEDYYAAAKRGHPVVRAECTGSGPAIRDIRFRHFRCVVIVQFAEKPYGDQGEEYGRGRVYVHVRDKTRLAYQWI